MILQEPERLSEVWREVRTWPVKSRVMLATRILQSVEDTIVETAPPSWERRQALETMIGFVKTDNPPDDAEVKRILLDERMEKYG
jgi:hypothetical protein